MIGSSKSLLIVLSGPSGVGKDAVISRMKELGHPLHFIVTATPRPKRAGERDGVDYLFLSEAKFQKMIEQGELLEWAEVYGHHYGVPKDQVKQALAESKDVMIKVDIQGAATIKRLLPQAVLIFLAPPSLEELTERVKGRETEASPDLKLRLETAKREMESLPLFDYVVVNQEIDQAVSQIKAIITAEKCRVNPRVVKLE